MSGSFFSVEDKVLGAARWAPEFGLSDGIQVGVAPGFASALGAQGTAEVLLLQDAVIAAFSAWENPALQFDITFDAATTVGSETGFEIDLIALRSTDRVFRFDPSVFGAARTGRRLRGLRTLTNGSEAFGLSITSADIYLNIDLIQAVTPLFATQQEQLAAITRLMMHEIGHTIGLGHPDPAEFFDTDLDPFNTIVVDPADPPSGFLRSPNVDTTAIMATRPCGPTQLLCPAIFFTELQPDDRGGRDTLYPVPEPSGLLWLVLGWHLAIRGSRLSKIHQPSQR